MTDEQLVSHRRALAEGYAPELPALRASHGRLMRALEEAMTAIVLHNSGPAGKPVVDEARSALSEARQISGAGRIEEDTAG